MAQPTLPTQHSTPFYRNVKMLAILAQVVFVIGVGFLLWFLYRNMINGLRRSSIPLGFDFLRQPAGFDLPDSGIRYQSSDSYGRAFVVGLVNTVRISILGIVLSTILGTLIGIGRLSSNWLLRTVAGWYVEIIRNTPLLVQLIFWFVAVIAKLPRVRDSVGIPGFFLVSNRGLALASVRGGPNFAAWQPWLWIGLLVGVAVYALKTWQLKQQDRPGMRWPQALLAAGETVLLSALVMRLVTGQSPIELDQPLFTNFNYTGGTILLATSFALLLGLTIYTAAFIAEIVRAGILSVNKGQREAAQALGFRPGQTLRLIILPQALRVVLPPLTNQYLNLTKNSSLGIAIGFADLFYVGNIVNNQSGRAVQTILIMMGCYLVLSLLTSFVTNLYNARIRLVER